MLLTQVPHLTARIFACELMAGRGGVRDAYLLGCEINFPLSVQEGLRDGLGLGLGHAAGLDLLDELEGIKGHGCLVERTGQVFMSESEPPKPE